MYLVHSRTEGPVEALPPEGTRKITKKPDTVFSPFGIFRVWNCFLDFFAYLCGAFEQLFELWCNGNTADFGSVVLGSNPGSSTRKERSPTGLLLLLSGVRARAGAGAHRILRCESRAAIDSSTIDPMTAVTRLPSVPTGTSPMSEKSHPPSTPPTSPTIRLTGSPELPP